MVLCWHKKDKAVVSGRSNTKEEKNIWLYSDLVQSQVSNLIMILLWFVWGSTHPISGPQSLMFWISWHVGSDEQVPNKQKFKIIMQAKYLAVNMYLFSGNHLWPKFQGEKKNRYDSRLYKTRAAHSKQYLHNTKF